MPLPQNISFLSINLNGDMLEAFPLKKWDTKLIHSNLLFSYKQPDERKYNGKMKNRRMGKKGGQGHLLCNIYILYIT